MESLLFNKIRLLIILFICSIGIYSQNLVPNYSFEDTVARVTPLFLPAKWRAPTNEGYNYMTPFNNLSQQHLQFSTPSNFSGYQQARTGSAYIGMLIYHLNVLKRNPRREYIQVKLNRKLIFDSTYCFQLYASLADSVRFASRGQLGIYFSTNAVGANNTINLPYTPQLIVSPNNYINDKVNWIKYDMQYKAQGGEEYITIGNFNDTNAIDTSFVGGGDPNNVDFLNTYYYIDDVWLSHCDSLPDSLIGIRERSLQNQLTVYPNPIQKNFTLRSKNKKPLSFSLYNVLGKAVPFSFTKTRDAYEIIVGDIPKGIYFLKVDDGKEQTSIKLIKN